MEEKSVLSKKSLREISFEFGEERKTPEKIPGIFSYYDIQYDIFIQHVMSFLGFRDIFWGMAGASLFFKNVSEESLKCRSLQGQASALHEIVYDIRKGFIFNQKVILDDYEVDVQKKYRWDPTEDYLVKLIRLQRFDSLAIQGAGGGFSGNRRFLEYYVRTFCGEALLYPKVIQEMLVTVNFADDQIIRMIDTCLKNNVMCIKKKEKENKILTLLLQMMYDVDPFRPLTNNPKLSGLPSYPSNFDRFQGVGSDNYDFNMKLIKKTKIFTPLSLSFTIGSIPLVEMFIQKSKVKFEKQKNESAIAMSLNNQSPAIVKSVDDSFVDCVADHITDMKKEIFELLINHEFSGRFFTRRYWADKSSGTKKNKNIFNRLLVEICKNGCREGEIVDMLITPQQKEEDEDEDLQELLLESLLLACENGRSNVVEKLLSHLQRDKEKIHERISLFRRLDFFERIFRSTCMKEKNSRVLELVLPFCFTHLSSQPSERKHEDEGEEEDEGEHDDEEEISKRSRMVEDILEDDDDIDPILEDDEKILYLRRLYTMNFHTLMSCGDCEMINFFILYLSSCPATSTSYECLMDEFVDFSGKVLEEMFDLDVYDFVENVLSKGRYKDYVDKQSPKKWSMYPFWVSCKLGDKTICKFMLKHVAKKELDEEEKSLPFRIAFHEKKWTIVRWLIKEKIKKEGLFQVPFTVFGESKDVVENSKNEIGEEVFDLLSFF